MKVDVVESFEDTRWHKQRILHKQLAIYGADIEL